MRHARWFVLAALVLAPLPVAAQDDNALGQEVYDRWCATCHGVDGDGKGPGAGYMLPRPRDFTAGLYQIRTTGSGALPADADILRVIDEGIPGSTMPGWTGVLSSGERQALVGYLKTFSRFFTQLPAPDVIDFGSAPSGGDDAIAEGREFYETIECWKCHGDQGRGDGESAPTLGDDWEMPVRAADLTGNWRFNGGGSVEDIYQRLRTGLDGTPMATFQEMIEAGIMTEGQLWNLAHYVRSLAPPEAPRPRELISVPLLEDGSIPDSPDDPAWDSAERYYIPMVGQIILKPRWFDPRVNALWIQAVHDGSEVAIRLSWTDPSQSPDASWDEWRTRVVELMEPKEGDHHPGPHPDRIAIQFPSEMPEDERLPYFLMGDTRSQVYLWNWSSTDGGSEMNVRGFGSELRQASQDLGTQARFLDGEWSVVFKRTFSTADEEDLQFGMGQAIPFTFFAWDGDNGEYEHRSAVSSWYFLALEDVPPATVFVAPALALALTAMFGFLVVGRAQKRAREGQ